jgi:hypothetical protein
LFGTNLALKLVDDGGEAVCEAIAKPGPAQPHNASTTAARPTSPRLVIGLSLL